MKTALTAGAALLMTTAAATAGGIDRTGNPYSVLFEEGNYVQLSFNKVMPEVSGDYPRALGGGSTGNMSEDYMTFGAAVKYQFNPQMSVALFFSQPYGADAFYPQGAYTGLAAEWDANSIAAVLKYQVNPNISVYGGARSVESQANITIPNALNAAGVARGLADGATAAANGAREAAAGAQAAVAAGDLALAAELGAQAEALQGQALELQAQAQAAAASAANDNPTTGPFAYNASTDADRQTSYIVGAAYERPDIALRVALTYETGYTHSFEATESLPGVGLNGTSQLDIEMPRAVTLDFQSGVAADTLVFGSIRWSEWSVWEVRPAGYEAFSGDRVTGIDNDVYTYRLGVGRRINDQLSVFGRVTYEAGNDDVASRLAPTDGTTSIGLGGSYTVNGAEITAGVEYAWLGDATDASGVEFTDNTALGVGISVGYSF